MAIDTSMLTADVLKLAESGISPEEIAATFTAKQARRGQPPISVEAVRQYLVRCRVRSGERIENVAASLGLDIEAAIAHVPELMIRKADR